MCGASRVAMNPSSHEFDTPSDEQLGSAVRGMKDLLASVAKAKQAQESFSERQSMREANAVGAAAPPNVPQATPMPVTSNGFMSLLGDSVRLTKRPGEEGYDYSQFGSQFEHAAGDGGMNTQEQNYQARAQETDQALRMMHDHDRSMQLMQDSVRSELWGDLVSIDVLNKQVDRNLGMYSDLFEEWHAEKALKRAYEHMVASKCLRAWRQWVRFKLSPQVQGYLLMDYRKFPWHRCGCAQRVIASRQPCDRYDPCSYWS